MKVLYVIQRLPGFTNDYGGGVERQICRTINTLIKFDSNYQPLVYVANKKDPNSEFNYSFNILEDSEEKHLIQTLGKFNSRDTILHLHDEYIALHKPEIFEKLPRFWKGPIIQMIPVVSKIDQIDAMLKKRGGPHLSSYFAPVSMFISQGTAMTSQLIEEYKIDLYRIAQIENGIDCSKYSDLPFDIKMRIRKELIPEIKDDQNIFLYAGRLTAPMKKVHQLLDSWLSNNISQKNYLILAGNHNNFFGVNSLTNFLNKNSLTKIVSKYNVRFTGLLNENNLLRWYQASDIYINPSAKEGMSNAEIEAMACGLPIIGRKGVCGHDQLIILNKTGLLFNNAEELIDNMTILSKNRNLRLKLGANARTHIKNHFSAERMANNYARLYKLLLKKI